MPVYSVLAAQHGEKIFQRNGRSAIFLTGVMTVHQVSEGQAQHIGQRLQRVDVWQPDAAFPAADPVRPASCSAPGALVQGMHQILLHPFCSHPFPQDNTGMWKTQPTERLPAGLQNKKDVLPCGNTSFFIASVSGGDQLTAGGRQRPEPCRARCLRTWRSS